VSAEARWTRRSGARIRYLANASSREEGLPLVFSPGLTDFADDYLDLLDLFLPRHALVVEVRGRGGSEVPPQGYGVSDHVRDLVAVLDEEGIGRFHLMTFSRGTSWGLELALDQPQRVASMAIGDYKAVEVQLEPSFVDQQLATRFRGRPVGERVTRHVLEGLVTDSRDRQLWDRLAALPFPLLVAQPGGEGGLVTDDDVSRYRAARPDVEVVVVPGAHHDIFRPDRLFFPTAVAEFIARRCPGA